MSKAKFAALAASVFACSAAFSVQAQSAPEPAAQPAPAAPAVKASISRDHDPNQVICKHEEETGTRLGGHKECHTRADWEQMARESERATTLMQSASGPGVVGH